jgi:hypothetical protein
MTKNLKGTIVMFMGGFYRVTSHRAQKVNLAGVFGGRIYYKGISEFDVMEAEAEFYEQWSKSETYMSM